MLAGVNANVVNSSSHEQETVMHLVARLGKSDIAQVLRPFVTEETLEILDGKQGKRAWEITTDNKLREMLKP